MTFSESSIRPDGLFNEYLSLAKQDCVDFFGKASFHHRQCPICDSSGSFIFKKSEFKYFSCDFCSTLYINPCPDASSFRNFYKNSSSALFWSTTFYKETELSRKTHLWQPKCDYILNYVGQSMSEFNILDIGCGYGAFLDVASSSLDSARLLGVEPNSMLANVCVEKGHKVLNCFLQDVSFRDLQLPDIPTVFTCFELLEHITDPYTFLQQVYDLMKPGDYLFLTTLSGTGIDIALLGPNSKSVSPPHHVLFLNPTSARLLSKRIGFSSCIVDTPGVLDIDILQKNTALFASSHPQTFSFLTSLPENLKVPLQGFLAENLLSSHLRLILIK